MNPPSNLQHMPEQTRDDVCLMRFLLKICDKFEVGMIFHLLGCSGERYINMITGDPFVQVVFNLKGLLALLRVL